MRGPAGRDAGRARLAAQPGGHGLPGLLVVLEGIDRSGRSTHVRLLEKRLRYAGHGVSRTSLAASRLAGDLIRQAKQAGRTDPVEIALLYAADLAERVEQVVLPSLRAGLAVLADRYAWTPIARAEARGVAGAWLDALFTFAPAPDVVLYLDVDPATSLARRDAEPDPFEAGLDLALSADAWESYGLFQARLAACFERHIGSAAFTSVRAVDSVDVVQRRLDRALDRLLATRPLAGGR